MKQISFMQEEDIEQEDAAKEKVLHCNYHYWAKHEHFIDHTQKNGKVVKRCVYCIRRLNESRKIRIADLAKERENLATKYICRTLRGSGVKLKDHEIPEPLIEIKRESIRLKRAIDDAQKPLYRCDRHGDLFKNGVIKKGNLASCEPSYRCRECFKAIRQRHYEKNREKVLAKHAEYKKNNPEKWKQTKKESRKRHPLKGQALLNKQKRAREWERTHYKEFTDRYVKKQLVKRTGLGWNDLPQELVDAMREIMKLKRQTKISIKEQIIKGEDNG